MGFKKFLSACKYFITLSKPFVFGLQPPNFLEVQSKVRQPKVISEGNRSTRIELSFRT